LLKFWELLSDADFTGRPSELTEDDVRQLAKTVGMLEAEIEACDPGAAGVSVPRGIKIPSDLWPSRSGTAEKL